ncbi:MAG: hypothetical protein M1820_002445 [Bogoriella megaspora]|nr:MAG: hypothetical protein M1820_002445 [Bogoriella megaspora]
MSERVEDVRFELFKSEFADPLTSDLTITCGSRTWPVQKALVCRQSSFFANACKDRFKEGQQRRIDLEEDDPDVVHAMLEFLYTGDYGDNFRIDGHRSISWLIFNIRIFAIAQKYDIKHLQKYALDGASSDLGEQEQPETGSFSQAIDYFYRESLEHGEYRECLRQALVDHACTHHLFLLENDEGFKDVLGKHMSFNADVMKALGRRAKTLGGSEHSEIRQYRCANCRTISHYNIPDDTRNNLVPCMRCWFSYTVSTWKDNRA